jgi:hypothetical protein
MYEAEKHEQIFDLMAFLHLTFGCRLCRKVGPDVRYATRVARSVYGASATLAMLEAVGNTLAKACMFTAGKAEMKVDHF